MTLRITKAEQGPLLAEATEMVWHKTTIRMYGVSENQLEELTAGYNSLYLVFFGICVGAAISLRIAFGQSSVASDKQYYMIGFLAALGFAVLSGIAAITNYAKAARCKRKLYKEAVPIQR